MSEETIIEHCSPTLARLKTGNLFSCNFSDQSEMARDIRRFNKVLVPKGLCMLPLKYCNGKALLYVFRPAMLYQDLSQKDSREILDAAGYPREDLMHQLQKLMNRLRHSPEFPHEIGLFLSYPPEDVRGFIEQGPNRCKKTGFWKVYGNEEMAERIFSSYRHCHDVYVRQLRAGVDFSSLVVQEKQRI
ncbi:MAG: DUF3793 family protein [Eubacterium sp.]|nr:DUF3793 family protein [Eubacterium sp.]